MKRRILLLVLCVLFLGIAGYFGVQTYQQWSEYHLGEKTYDDLARYVHTETPAPMKETAVSQEATEVGPFEKPDDERQTLAADTADWPEVDFAALQAINPDITAWICIEGTDINYPVVQGMDNSYYLRRLVDGRYNSAGSIFMDYRNTGDFSDRNNIIYGHNMQNGTMFQQITKYKEQSFYDEHPACQIMTPNGNYRLEFFAGYVVDMNSQAWKLEFATDEEYTLWQEDAISRSTFTGSVDPTAQDRVVTLSTCTYEYDDARYVLVGVLK